MVPGGLAILAWRCRAFWVVEGKQIWYKFYQIKLLIPAWKVQHPIPDWLVMDNGTGHHGTMWHYFFEPEKDTW